MEFVKLKTRYYNDAGVLRAGEAAEVLFTRALAYSGDQETDGFIPTQVLAMLTPTRGRTRAAALVREGLWVVVPGGWQITGWDKHQTTTEQLEAKRAAGRDRVAAHRARKKTTPTPRNAVGNAVTNGERCSTEVRGKREDNAAAAALGAGTPTAAAAAIAIDDDPDTAQRPVKVEILRSKLQRHTPLAGLRFDTLTPAQLATLEQLIDLHGDDRLVDTAVTTCRNPPPIAVTAFLGTWAALPPPGQRLAVVRLPDCPEHGTPVTPGGVCRACEADRKAAR